MSEVEKALGKRLQEARQAAGLTQQDLCHQAGIAYSTLAKIERGAIKAPSIFTIEQIATVLGTSLDALVGHKSPSLPAPKKQSKSGVSFIFFDVNGCLVRSYQQAFTRIAEDSAMLPDIVEDTFWHYNDAACNGDISMEEFNQLLGERFDMPHFDWRNYYLAEIEPIPEMHRFVVEIAKQYRVGLLTNIMPGIVTQLRARKLIPDIEYEVIIDSSEVHAIKPENKIFEIAQQKAGVPANELLLVDDEAANLRAAQKQGWHVLRFESYQPAQSVAKVQEALEPAN